MSCGSSAPTRRSAPSERARPGSAPERGAAAHASPCAQTSTRRRLRQLPPRRSQSSPQRRLRHHLLKSIRILRPLLLPALDPIAIRLGLGAGAVTQDQPVFQRLRQGSAARSYGNAKSRSAGIVAHIAGSRSPAGPSLPPVVARKMCGAAASPPGRRPNSQQAKARPDQSVKIVVYGGARGAWIRRIDGGEDLVRRRMAGTAHQIFQDGVSLRRRTQRHTLKSALDAAA